MSGVGRAFRRTLFVYTAILQPPFPRAGFFHEPLTEFLKSVQHCIGSGVTLSRSANSFHCGQRLFLIVDTLTVAPDCDKRVTNCMLHNGYRLFFFKEFSQQLNATRDQSH